MESWASEQQYYNYDQNTCASGRVCGHYTQLVWSSTQRLGCGRAAVSTTNGRNYVIWACNYAPPGNYNNQRPYSLVQSSIRSQQPAWQLAWSPTAIDRVTEHLDLFMMGNDGRVYTSWWHEGSEWSGINDNWRSIGGFFPVPGS